MRSPRKISHQGGFSLLEMSVVITVVGLLVGGVTAGLSLIRQAELQAVLAESKKYISATNSFQELYGFYPGDMPNASSLWIDPVDCKDEKAPDGCNGSGNQKIGEVTISLTNAAATTGNAVEVAEIYRAWQHLSLAELITGHYSGVGAGTSNMEATPQNSPASVREGGLYYLTWLKLETGQKASQRLCLGAQITDDLAKASILSTREIWAMDDKVDDANPVRGNIQSFLRGEEASASTQQCYTGSGTGAQYNLSQDIVVCRPCFSIDMYSTDASSGSGIY